MLEYFAALFSLREARDLARSALPDAPVRHHRDGRKTDPNRGSREPAPPTHPSVAAGPNGSSEWDPCPCGWWGASRADRHGCVALVKELFPQLDQELDAWDAEHGWLYR